MSIPIAPVAGSTVIGTTTSVPGPAVLVGTLTMLSTAGARSIQPVCARGSEEAGLTAPPCAAPSRTLPVLATAPPEHIRRPSAVAMMAGRRLDRETPESPARARPPHKRESRDPLV